MLFRSPSRAIPLECCPVVWVRNDAEATATADQVDGHALIEGLEDEVEALDFELSQLYRNALYNGEPQLVQIGVDGDASMSAPVGQTAKSEGFSWFNGVVPEWASRLAGRGTTTAMKKAPGKVWKLPQGGDAKMIESTGAGAGIIAGAIKELRRVLTDASGVVLFDADSLGGGDLAARTLQLMHAPMLDHADNLRVEYGDALMRILSMMLRVLSSQAARAGGVMLASYDAALPALDRLAGADAVTGARRWIGPALSLAWGDYFAPSAADKAAAIDTALKATGNKPVLTQRTALANVAAMFSVADVDAEAAEVERESGVDRSAVASTLASLTEAPSADETTSAAEAPAAVADTALNGAQVASLVDVVVKVASGELPRGAAKAIIKRAFAVDDAGAEAILDDAGAGFSVAPKPPVPSGGG